MEECSKAEHSSNHLNNWGFPNFANTGGILNTLHLGMVYYLGLPHYMGFGLENWESHLIILQKNKESSWE
jgi:hypothetical protein